MSLITSFRMLALYNQRMNNKLIAACRNLSDEQLNEASGGFFNSLLDHWNHLLFADLIMLQRLATSGFFKDIQDFSHLPIAKGVHDKFVSNLKDLASLRQKIDAIYIGFFKSLSPQSADAIVRYTTTEGQVLSKSLGDFCLHLFNHQTHHRGQITCLLSQYGIDYGSTDLPVVVPKGENI